MVKLLLENSPVISLTVFWQRVTTVKLLLEKSIAGKSELKSLFKRVGHSKKRHSRR